MQTTLRVEDDLYKEAKICAVREGISLSQLLNQALRQRVSGTPYRSTQKVSLPIFKKENDPSQDDLSPEKIKSMLNESDLEHDLKWIGKNKCG